MSLEDDYLKVRAEKLELEKKLKDKEELLEEAIFLTCLELSRKLGIEYPHDFLEVARRKQGLLIAKFANIDMDYSNKEEGSKQFHDFMINFPREYADKMLNKL